MPEAVKSRLEQMAREVFPKDKPSAVLDALARYVDGELQISDAKAAKHVRATKNYLLESLGDMQLQVVKPPLVSGIAAFLTDIAQADQQSKLDKGLFTSTDINRTVREARAEANAGTSRRQPNLLRYLARHIFTARELEGHLFAELAGERSEGAGGKGSGVSITHTRAGSKTQAYRQALGASAKRRLK